MPTTQPRTFVDPDTGETSRIETTKQAKRRYMRNGGAQWKPTKGQMNAADIWNRQEAKIQKEREREEKRKKNNVRQAQKEAQLKQRQQERLASGEISIEDTWGKVSSSQVRLTNFFEDPRLPRCRLEISKSLVAQSPKQGTEYILSKAREPCPTGHTNLATVQQSDGDHDTHVDHPQISPSKLFEPLNQNSICSDLSCDKQYTIEAHKGPDVKKTIPSGQGHGIHGMDLGHSDLRKMRNLDSGPLNDMSKRPSQTKFMMLPPVRLATPKEAPKFYGGSLNTCAGRATSPHIFSVLTSAGLSTTGDELMRLTSAENALCAVPKTISPVPTQVIRETLTGLSSQDFVDDLENVEHEQNPLLPVPDPADSTERQSVVLESHRALPKNISELKDQKHCPHVAAQNASMDKYNAEKDVYEFNDNDIDDETLMKLVATQQSRKELLPSNEASSKDRFFVEGSDTNMQGILSANTKGMSVTTGPKSDESFAMSSIDDEDLLRCMQSFENVHQNITDDDLVSFMNRFDQTHAEAASSNRQPLRRKGRVLPWIKKPAVDMHDTEYNIPSSQKTDVLEG